MFGTLIVYVKEGSGRLGCSAGNRGPPNDPRIGTVIMSLDDALSQEAEVKCVTLGFRGRERREPPVVKEPVGCK